MPSEGQSIRFESTIEEGGHDSARELELDMSGYSELLGGGSEKVVEVAVIAKAVGEVTTVVELEAEQGASSAVGGARGGTTAELDDDDKDNGGSDDEEAGVDEESGLVVDGAEPPPQLLLM